MAMKTEGFGFCPEESTHHFVVFIPPSNRTEVLISEHYGYDAEIGRAAASLGSGADDGKARVLLARSKWNAIADDLRVEINRRLKKQGLKTSAWKTGNNPISRLLGKELVLLAWAIEDADPALIPNAIKNWLGLQPEERWWLYTMTNAATGHALHGRGKGWRKAVRFALTENPAGAGHQEPPPRIFQLIGEERAEYHAEEAPLGPKKRKTGRR